MKYAPAISLGLSVILGIFAFVLFSGFGSAEDRPVEIREVQAAPTMSMTEVLVAGRDFLPAEAITPAEVRVVEWPIEHLPEGALTSVEMLQSGGGQVRFSQATIFEGELLTHVKAAWSPPRRMLSTQIEDGMRAVSIAVTNETGVAGFVLPGDHVDIFAYIPVPGGKGPDANIPRPMLENVEVLGVDQTFGNRSQGAIPATFVTLALTPEQAQKISAAARGTRLGLTLIGEDEREANEGLKPEESEDTPAPRLHPVARASVPAPRAEPVSAPRPENTTVTVVLGTAAKRVSAPVDIREEELEGAGS
ncbi:MAG: Flp pilus assembly protein CpaB [Pseudomonadota bacterium]